MGLGSLEVSAPGRPEKSDSKEGADEEDTGLNHSLYAFNQHGRHRHLGLLSGY